MPHPRARLLALGALLGPSVAAAQPGAAPATPVEPTPPAAEPVPAPAAFHHHFPFTVEAGGSLGVVRVPAGGGSSRLDSTLFGLRVGAGGWITDRLAVSALFSAAGYNHASAEDRSNYRHAFLGPSAQYWLTDWLWVSGGLGLGLQYRKPVGRDTTYYKGFAADLRIGRSFPLAGPHQLEFALELIPSHYSIDSQTKNYQVVLMTIGYQLL